MLPSFQPLLKRYVMIRWRCLNHDFFETGTLVHQQAANCPTCGQPAELIEHCEGMTTRELPFTTKPRPEWDGLSQSTSVSLASRAPRRHARKGSGKAPAKPLAPKTGPAASLA